MPGTKKLISVVILSFCIHVAKAANYYFSTANGNDSRSTSQAQNPSTPWRTIGKLNSIMSLFQSGDNILFNRGEVFSGSIIAADIPGGAGIMFDAYGTGKNPEITGFTTLSNWQNAGNGIWTTKLSAVQPMVNTVLLNGISTPVGRYPNVTAVNKGYLTIGSCVGYTSITDPQLSSSPNWTGGQLVIRKTRWVLDNSLILSHFGNTINYASQSTTTAAPGYGYFIQNHPCTLDVAGEWYYSAANNVFGIYTGGTNPSTSVVKAGTVSSLVQISGQSNLTFQNLNFTGAVNSAFEINSAKKIHITKCNILYSGKNAFNLTNTDDVTVDNCLINYTNNIALNVINCSNTTFNANIIKNTGTKPGMGDGEAGSYSAVQLSGDNNTMVNNTIDSTGYNPILFAGNHVNIKNNVISNFCFEKDDGGGIYTWNNGPGPPVNYGRVISGNIVINGIGAGAGSYDTSVKGLAASGIYLDDNVANVDVNNNTVANCATFGLYIHNSYNLSVTGNTLYNNNAAQIAIVHDNIAPDSPIKNLRVSNNVFVSKYVSQPVGEFKTKDNDLSGFGTFDNNYYARPFDDNLVISVSQQINGTYDNEHITLGGWKARYHLDGRSNTSPVQIQPYRIQSVVGANKFSNGNFDTNINGLYAYSLSGNCKALWNTGPLDGGTLKVAFSSETNSSSYASVIIDVGDLTKGKKYLLKFSLYGTGNNKVLTSYLRQSKVSYSDLSDRLTTVITETRTDNQVVFVAKADERDASIVFNIDEQTNLVYLDNVVLTQVNAVATVPDKYISLYLNPTSAAKTLTITNPGIDVKKKSYQKSVTLQPYTSVIVLSHSAASSISTHDAAAGTMPRKK